MPQQGTAGPRVEGPLVAGLRQELVPEPLQADEGTHLFGLLDLVDELTRRLVEIKLGGRPIRRGAGRLPHIIFATGTLKRYELITTSHLSGSK